MRSSLKEKRKREQSIFQTLQQSWEKAPKMKQNDYKLNKAHRVTFVTGLEIADMFPFLTSVLNDRYMFYTCYLI